MGTDLIVPSSADDYLRAPVRCGQPIRLGDGWARCGKCYVCKSYEAAILAQRIDLEAQLHHNVAFVTLTYSNANLPADGCVNLEDPTLWLKRLRKRATRELGKLRYYYLAEYGGYKHRPHYHVVLYGYPPCIRGKLGTYHGPDGVSSICCPACEVLSSTWGKGRIDNVPYSRRRSGYLAHYVANRAKDIDPLPPGLKPEFARWSRQPGLGSGMVPFLVREQVRNGFSTADAPVSLEIMGNMRPVGTYLRDKIREALGSTPERRMPEAIKRAEQMAAAILACRELGTSIPALGAKLCSERVKRAVIRSRNDKVHNQDWRR